LYNETIIPLLDRIQGDLNEWLVPMFNEQGLELRYDIDSIPAMAEQRKRVFESVSAGVKEGILTRNEAREALGYEPMEGADSLLVPANLMPLNLTDDIIGENVSEEIPPEVIPNDLIEDEDGDIDEVIKAISDINTTPTESMVFRSQKGIAWRKEFNRGGTRIGAVRASQIIAKEKLSPSTVKRMFSFFSRHEVDKQAEGFSVGEKGYPSNGRIAWALWGGDAGFSWSTKVRNQLEKEKKIFN